MPIYEYHCTTCKENSEFIQKISDALMTQCPHCKNTTLKRLLSPPRFQLKGTGWYVTDFRDKGKTKPTKDDKEKPTEKSDKSKKENKKSKE